MMLYSSISSTFPRLILPARKSPADAAAGNGHGDERILPLSHQRRRRRGISVVTRAGPSATVYIAALVLPLSLLAITIVTSVKIADELDEKFFEEVAINEAILEAEENSDASDMDGISITSPKEPTPMPVHNRNRNRPKREVESSSLSK